MTQPPTQHPNQPVGNVPGASFDPNAAARRAGRGRRRGRRPMLVIGVVAVVALLAAGLQLWIFGLGGKVDAQQRVRETKAEVPPYNIPEPEVVMPPPPMPDPPPPPVQPERPRRLAGGGPRGPQGPTAIAFNVATSGEVPTNNWFVDGRLPQMAYGCALRPGASMIHATLESVINSEVGGMAIASVSEDVHDADGLGRTLIPMGSKMTGVFKTGDLDFNSRRLGIVWQHITMPDGTELNLDDTGGMDAAGSTGMGGEVHTQWGTLIATAALLTIFDGIQRSAVQSTADDSGYAAGFQQALSYNTGQLGKEVTKKVLNWKPIIIVPSGTQVIAAPSKAIQVCDY